MNKIMKLVLNLIIISFLFAIPCLLNSCTNSKIIRTGYEPGNMQEQPNCEVIITKNVDFSDDSSEVLGDLYLN